MSAYYVDTAGDDDNSGLSELLPWETVDKVNDSSFNAGDSCLFKKTRTWREQLTVPSSGSAGNPITFGAYGTGVDPIVSGADDITASTWAAGSVTVTPTVSTSKGDAELKDEGTYVDNNTYLRFGKGSVNTYNCGVCFTAVNVPQGATITAAKLTFIAAQNVSGTTANARIYAEAADGPAASFTNKADYEARIANLTTEYVDWSSIGAWTQESSYDTPDITDVIQEIVDRAGWVSGNNITVFIKDNASSTSAYRQPDSYDYGSKFPVLSVTYSVANVYSTTLAADPNAVWFDGVSYPEAASATAVDSTNRWFWSSGDTRLYVYATSDPNGFYSDIEAPVRDFAILIYAKNYVIFDGLTGQYGKAGTMSLQSCNYTTVRNCLVRYASGYPGIGQCFSIIGLATYNIIEDSVVDGSNAGQTNDAFRVVIDGVNVPDHNTIQRNIIKNGTHNALNVIQSTNNTIQYNNIYQDSVVYGRCVSMNGDVGVGGNVFRYNYVHDGENGPYSSDGNNMLNGDGNFYYGNIFANQDGYGWELSCLTDGTDSTVCANNLYYNNVVYASTQGGVSIYVAAGDTGNLVKNNIFMANGAALSNYEIRFHPSSVTTGFVFQYNDFYNTVTSSTIYDGGAARTVAYMESNDPTHWSSNIVADPLFTNAAGGDFTLQAGSPCIDAGVDLGTDYQMALAPGSTWS